MFKRSSILAGLVMAMLAIAAAPLAAAPPGPGLIRDSEVENTIRVYAAPLFEAAGLEPEAVRVFIVHDKTLNAFVAGGMNIFVTTGLLQRVESPGQLIGVLAHETGHIAGGHLARFQGALENASTQAIVAQIIGLILAAGTGQPGAAVFGAAGADAAERTLLSFSRAQEQAADQAAIKFLNESGQSPKGLAEFLEIISDQELLVSSRQDPYVRTHPLTRDRVRFAENQADSSAYRNKPASHDFMIRFGRMQAKLDGFLNPPGSTLQKYKESDTSVPARYARAIALYHIPDLPKALPLIDGLIAEAPNDPYFRELKGQVLFENGRVAEAMAPYREAVRLAPAEPLLRVQLAHVQIELNRKDLIPQALNNLKAALEIDKNYPLSWRLAATAYGRHGELGMAALSLAEYNVLTNRRVDAKGQAARAKRLLKRGSPSWLRADDIERLANEKSR